MESTSDEVKEVYVQFGLAYCYSEVLHRRLCNLYALSMIPGRGGMTRPRMEEHFAKAYGSTFGRIVQLVQPVLPEQLWPRVATATDLRNYLANRFWFERVHLTTTSKGAGELCVDLTGLTETLQVLNREVESLVEPYRIRLGFTGEVFREAAEKNLLSVKLGLQTTSTRAPTIRR